MSRLLVLLVIMQMASNAYSEPTAEDLEKEAFREELREHIRTNVRAALLLGATPAQITEICKGNPTCLEALEKHQ